MSDTEREAFEAWAEPAGYELHLMNSGGYLSVYTRDAWTGWQARGRRTTTTEARAPETRALKALAFLIAAIDTGLEIPRATIDEWRALAAGAPATPSPPSLDDPKSGGQ